MGFFLSFTLFLAVYWFFRSPIPAAIAGSIRRDGAVTADTNMSNAIGLLGDEVRGLRQDVTELAERIDVSERVRRPATTNCPARPLGAGVGNVRGDMIGFFTASGVLSPGSAPRREA